MGRPELFAANTGTEREIINIAIDYTINSGKARLLYGQLCDGQSTI